MSDKFEKAAVLRATVITHIRDNPHQSTRQTADALGLALDTVARAMRAMTEVGELAKHGQGRSITYTVLTDSTYDAKEARDNAFRRRAESLSKTNAEKAQPKPKRGGEPWRHVHTPDRPVQNQGGQGALRRVAGIKSCADL